MGDKPFRSILTCKFKLANDGHGVDQKGYGVTTSPGIVYIGPEQRLDEKSPQRSCVEKDHDQGVDNRPEEWIESRQEREKDLLDGYFHDKYSQNEHGDNSYRREDRFNVFRVVWHDLEKPPFL